MRETAYCHAMTLKEYLKAKSLTQGEFAAKTGISQPTISKLVSGDGHGLSFDVAARIADVTDGDVPVSAWRQYEQLATMPAHHIA